MTFDEILAQIIDLLKRQGRVSYRALKMRFTDKNFKRTFCHPAVRTP
jgi:hypothetical protein